MAPPQLTWGETPLPRSLFLSLRSIQMTAFFALMTSFYSTLEIYFPFQNLTKKYRCNFIQFKTEKTEKKPQSRTGWLSTERAFSSP